MYHACSTMAKNHPRRFVDTTFSASPFHLLVYFHRHRVIIEYTGAAACPVQRHTRSISALASIACGGMRANEYTCFVSNSYSKWYVLPVKIRQDPVGSAAELDFVAIGYSQKTLIPI